MRLLGILGADRLQLAASRGAKHFVNRPTSSDTTIFCRKTTKGFLEILIPGSSHKKEEQNTAAQLGRPRVSKSRKIEDLSQGKYQMKEYFQDKCSMKMYDDSNALKNETEIN